MTDKREQIDEITDMFISGNCSKEFAEFEKLIGEQSEVYKRAYGDTEAADKYYDNKMKDMYARMGNTVLKQCKQLDFDENGGRKSTQLEQSTNISRAAVPSGTGQTGNVSAALSRAASALKKAMKKDFDSVKNQAAYDRLMEEQDRELGV